MVIDSKGAEGYLDSSIVCPVPVSKILTITVTKAPGAMSTTASPTPLPIITTISETYWDSLTLSIREWKTCNAWTKMLLLFNTTELTCKGTSRVVLSRYWGSVLLVALWQYVYAFPSFLSSFCLCRVVWAFLSNIRTLWLLIHMPMW